MCGEPLQRNRLWQEGERGGQLGYRLFQGNAAPGDHHGEQQRGKRLRQRAYLKNRPIRLPLGGLRQRRTLGQNLLLGPVNDAHDEGDVSTRRQERRYLLGDVVLQHPTTHSS